MMLHQRFTHMVSRVIVGIIFRILFRVRIVGQQRLPVSPTTGAIFVFNHVTQLESFLTPALFWWWPLRMLAKQELWNPIIIKIGSLKLPTHARGRYLSEVGQIPIRGSLSEVGIETAIEWVRGGGKIGGFPEGGRTDGRHVYRGHTGMARVAYATGASVFPVSVTGTDKIQWNKPWTWPFTRITFTIGGALSASGDNPSTEELAAFTERLMHAVARQAGLDYVDSYFKKPRPTSTL